MSDRQFSAAEVRISKCISRILRHRPEEAGVAMDEHGWVDTEALVKALGRQGYIVDSDCLDRMVYGNSKTRFAYNGDKTKIRACHGHTVKVDVELKAARPPKFLYHGTVGENTDSIAAEGLLPMKRLRRQRTITLPFRQPIRESGWQSRASAPQGESCSGRARKEKEKSCSRRTQSWSTQRCSPPPS